MVKYKLEFNFIAMHCPKCQSTKIIKYGHTHYGKPRFRCLDCGRQFVENPSRQPIDEATRVIIDKMLLERLALAAIARITGVSERWLQIYVNNKYEQIQQKKETGQTSYIERFNNTMGQRIGRLVRKTLSFSKKLSNHIG